MELAMIRKHILLSTCLILCNYVSSVAIAGNWYCPNGEVVYKPYSCVRNFYVNGGSGRDSNSGSQTSPWATIQRANDSGVLRGGDCVNVAAGTYVQSNAGYGGLALTNGGNANSSTGYVSYISAGGNAATITANGSVQNMINIEAPYIVLDGFNINASPASAAAIADVTGPGHHLMVLNNKISHAGGGGIAFNYTDYLTAYGNEVFLNAFTNSYRMSGISVYAPKTAAFVAKPADATLYHIKIQNNVVWGNSTKDVCVGKPAGCLHSDGHGIIADSWLVTSYPYPGLFQSNLTFNNGGEGIQIYNSANVVVANNTAYNNNLDTGITGLARGELSASGSHNVTFINNIMHAFPVHSDPLLSHNTAALEGQLIWKVSDYSNIIWRSNITFDGTVGDPSASFQTPTANTELATFVANNKAGVWPILTPYMPASNSPAIGAGSPTPSYPPKSLCGAPMSSPPNIGAY
jgi:parallel beta-helix repeat protein